MIALDPVLDGALQLTVRLREFVTALTVGAAGAAGAVAATRLVTGLLVKSATFRSSASMKYWSAVCV